MNCEKNLCNNVLKTRMGEKDIPSRRLNMQEREIRPNLWLRCEGEDNNRHWQLDAPYVLNEERLFRIFRRLCTMVANPNTEAELKGNVAETLVTLELELPLVYFDVIVHLTMHLDEELFICGSLQTQWMYPFEQYCKGFKGFVQEPC